MKIVWVSFLMFLSLVPPSAIAQEVPKDKEAPAAKAPTQKPEKFNLPLFFHPDDVGVKKSAYDLSWDLTNKTHLKVATLTLDADSFLPVFYSANHPTHPFRIAEEPGADSDSLFLIWPAGIIRSGNVELISRNGTVLWNDSFSDEDFKKWKKRIEKIRQATPEGKQKENKVLFASGIMLKNLNSDLLNQLKESFRFCLAKQNDKQRSMLCTPRYTVTKGEGGMTTLARVVETTEPRVLVDRENAPLMGNKPVQPGQEVSFFAQTSSGSSFEFLAKVQAVNIFDIFRDKDDTVLISGTDPVPIGAGIYESKNDEENFWNNLGWQQTMGDVRNYWQMPLPAKKEISIPGEAGGVFRLQLDFKTVPTHENRAWVSNQDAHATYTDKRLMHLYHNGKQNFQAFSPNEIHEDKENPGVSVWAFSAPKMGDYNRSTVDILEGSKTFKGSCEIYRGYSSELSTRMTGVVVANLQTAFLGEITYNKWFQDLWGWDNDQWSHLRWGLSTRYFKNLTPIDLSQSSQAAKSTEVSTLSVNLKYRFTPGLWGRDETWGLIFGGQSVSFSGAQAPLAGGGFFWARSMPRVINNVFELLPYMKYPKFVDMDFNIYPVSLDQGVMVKNAYNVNFHGKVLWTETFFGEAGFGMAGYAIDDSNNNLSVETRSFYATAGLGINF